MPGGWTERNPAGENGGADAAKLQPTAEESERTATERLEEIRQYLSDRQAQREVVAQTRTPGGLELDWVPIESQLGSGEKLAAPPEEDRRLELGDGERPVEPVRFELEREGAELGPEGTVPIVRTPINRIHPTVGLNDWLAKGRRAKQSPAPDSPHDLVQPETEEHKHAHSAQNVTCYGTEGNISAWDPFVEWSDEFSLGQLWLVRGSGANHQTLEVGHQQCYDIYGDWVPHLFVFYTTNDYFSQDDYEGGYNQLVKGWVQYATTIHPAALSTPLSEFGGVQYVMPLKVQLWEGRWWVRVNGTWIGYYPASLYNDDGLREEAARVDWGGEIVDSPDHVGTTRTDMGNGHWPAEGWQHCAFMSNLRYQSSPRGGMRDLKGNSTARYPDCYDIETHMESGTDWGSYFWWGGSGKNSGCP